MKEFETFCAKYEDHNSAIDIKKNNINIGPTVRIIDNNTFKLGFTLHKWEMIPTGKALGIYVFDNDFPNEFWDNPTKSIIIKDLNKKMSEIDKTFKSYTLTDLINKIENNEMENIKIFKYHASQWREVEKKKTKWAYKCKQEKTEVCNVQRLLL